MSDVEAELSEAMEAVRGPRARREKKKLDKERRKNKFRWQGVRVGLTCSQWRDTKLSMDEFSAWVKNNYVDEQPWGTVTKWCFAQEAHMDGKIHWHGMLEFKEKFSTRNPRAFDRECEGANNIHCHVAKVQSVKSCCAYIWKFEQAVGNVKKPEEKLSITDLKKMIQEGQSVKQLLMNDATCAHAARHLKVLREIEAIVRSEVKTEVKEEAVDMKRAQLMIDYVSKPNPDGRTVLWWHADPGAGKTTTLGHFANWCRENKREFYKVGADENSSRAAVKWRGEPVVIFDLPKNTSDKEVPYKFMEGVLDGEFQIGFGVDSRLERCMYGNKNVRGWVIVVANVDPNRLCMDKSYVMI